MLRCVILGMAGGLLLGGCASSTEVKIESLAKPKAEDTTFYQIHNANPAINADLFQYKLARVTGGIASTAPSVKGMPDAPPGTPADPAEYLDDKDLDDIVSTALSVKGMYVAPPGTHVELVVDVKYGISSPQRRYKTVSEPIYGSVPGESAPSRRTMGMDSDGHPINETVYAQGPSTIGATGFRDRTGAVDIYEKHLRLTARETKVAEGGQPAPEVWTVDVISEGENRDLRKALPILAAVAIDYVGNDAHGRRIIRRKDTDEHVVYVK